MKRELKSFGRSSRRFLLDLLFPRRCFGCRAFLVRGWLCEVCHGAWPVLKSPYCSCCCRPFLSQETENHLCGDCLSGEKSCLRLQAAGLYRGILHDMILRLKYRGEEKMAAFLGNKMAEKISSVPDIILPVPLHLKRLRERGYNQALLLARTVEKRIRAPLSPFLLVKKKSTPPQTELKGSDRRKNLEGAFVLTDPSLVAKKRILLVDDVYTTGTTIETVSSLLRKAGAHSVEALVAARTE